MKSGMPIKYAVLLMTCISLFISEFSYSQTRIERYADGTVKGKGEYCEFTYLRTQKLTIKLDKTKCKKKMGEWTYWYPEETIMSIENYKREKKGYNLEAVPHGIWKYYNLEGDSVKQEYYNDGQLISVEVFMNGTINIDDEPVNIELADTSWKKVSLSEQTGVRLIKENVFREGILIRREVFAGPRLFYSEIIAKNIPPPDENNLVSNPGFEEYRKNPIKVGELNQCMRSWSGASSGLPSYFCASSENDLLKVPGNIFGYQEAATGFGYAGIRIQNSEYLQNKLLQTLNADSMYCVEIQLSKGENESASIGELGVYFSSEKKVFRSSEKIFGHVVYKSPSGFTDTEDWQTLCQVYIAGGNEQYMTIGSFTEIPVANYFIDDVSVRHIQFESECDCSNEITFDMLEPQDIKEGMVVRLDFINFEEGSAKVTSDSEVEMANLAYLLESEVNMSIEIACHTDNSLNEDAAIQLSEMQSKAIIDYLIKRGIRDDRLTSKGYGFSVPLSDNKTEYGRNKNRRTEFRVISR